MSALADQSKWIGLFALFKEVLIHTAYWLKEFKKEIFLKWWKRYFLMRTAHMEKQQAYIHVAFEIFLLGFWIERSVQKKCNLKHQ